MINIRQQCLLDYLHAEQGKTVKQVDICYMLNNHYGYDFSRGEQHFHNSAARRLMTDDINAINNDDDVQNIIICTGKGIRLANEQEFYAYISRQYASVFRRLASVRKKDKKGSANGQYRFTDSYQTAVVMPFGDMRRRCGIRAADVVDKLKQIEPRFDCSLLSKIENGVCAPTPEQREAMLAMYDEGD